MEFFRWIVGLTPSRCRFNKNFLRNEDFTKQMMSVLVINEIEKEVVQMEMSKVGFQMAELAASMTAEHVPDYSWLATENTTRRRKNLSLEICSTTSELESVVLSDTVCYC
ncbi:unnamed protein product [Gongylonema pulchrum]|uniref:Ovule protein n=1 Tax=Gongylonema pulchrum TaxID=637853 RepID=A0A183ESM9_9BILA|nr:unnamed protein product [Gongylonema pulchrum]